MSSIGDADPTEGQNTRSLRLRGRTSGLAVAPLEEGRTRGQAVTPIWLILKATL